MRIRNGFLAALLVLAGACGGKLPSGPDEPLVPGDFHVLEAGVRVSESYPARVTLELVGRLPNVCSELLPAVQRRVGDRVEVVIATRSTSEVCILLLPPPMRLDVPLAGSFTTGDYVALVNGFELRFRI